jgi:hypothetical protein
MHKMFVFYNCSRMVTKEHRYFILFIKTNALQLDESQNTILGKMSSVLNKKFKRKMSIKTELLVFHPLSDGDVRQCAQLSNTLEYDAPFQSAGVAGSTIM